MKAEILCVGTELLMGQIANTNAQYISRRLGELGIDVYWHSVVGDNPARLIASLDHSLLRSDLVIMTGGLGPTQDDLTKQTVASYFNLEMKLEQEILENMKKLFEKMGKKMSSNNERQAYFPEGCKILFNDMGTAPGCIIEKNNKTVVLFPGPPREMIPMFEKNIIEWVKNKTGKVLVSKYIKVFGVGESSVETLLYDLIDNQKNPTIATYAKIGEVTIRLTAACENKTEGYNIIAPIEEEIQKRLGNYIYSTENLDLTQVVSSILIDKNITLSVAESCTGGLLSSGITKTPGVSEVFKGGIIAYNNLIKIELLRVKEKTIREKGAVSAECAKEMAISIRKMFNTDIGIGITGIAGPGGGTEEKPVGLVYVAISNKDETIVKKLLLWGKRDAIRGRTVMHALDLIRRVTLDINPILEENI